MALCDSSMAWSQNSRNFPLPFIYKCTCTSYLCSFASQRASAKRSNVLESLWFSGKLTYSLSAALCEGRERLVKAPLGRTPAERPASSTRGSKLSGNPPCLEGTGGKRQTTRWDTRAKKAPRAPGCKHVTESPRRTCVRAALPVSWGGFRKFGSLSKDRHGALRIEKMTHNTDLL